jgi:hypothetical protein
MDDLIQMVLDTGGDEALGVEGQLVIIPVVFLPMFVERIRNDERNKQIRFVERKGDEYEKRGMKGAWELCASLIAAEMRDTVSE